MAGFLEIDDSELRMLEADLSGAPTRVRLGARADVMQGARLIDKAMVADASGHRYLPDLPKHVSHEMIGPLEAEIGIAPGGQGSLAHIIVYGSVNNAPVYDHTAGPRRVVPFIENDFADTAEDSVLGSRG